MTFVTIDTSLCLSLSVFLSFSLVSPVYVAQPAVLITALTFTDLSLMFPLASAFVPSVCRSPDGKLTIRRDTEDRGIIRVSERPYGFTDRDFSICRSADDRAAVDCKRHTAALVCTRGCCIINFHFSTERSNHTRSPGTL